MSRRFSYAPLSMLVLLQVFISHQAFACACGCGVFDVGTGTMMPTDAGGLAWLEYDYMDQNRNWSGSKPSNAANNTDKELVTDFLVAGGQYMFNRSWGVETELPYTIRYFSTTGDDGGPASYHHAALGDIHVKAIYSGFSDDMSTGLTFGFKLPTGDYKFSGFDRDTSTGTGSTDWLVGGYHQGQITDDGKFDWFVNGQWDHAFTVASHYRPGDEFDTAVGSYYKAGSLTTNDSIAPLLQLIGSYRLHDVGFNADPDGSGYRRLLISPGIEYDISAIKLYADVEVPIYQNVNGNQITAPVYTKLVVGYNF